MFAPSVEVKAVYERLEKAQVNEIVTYAELKELIAMDPRGRGYAVVKSAREKILREKQYVFEVERKHGIKRLAPADIIESSGSNGERIRRISKKAFQKLTSVNGEFATLTHEQKMRHNMLASVYGAIAHMTSKPTLKRVEAKLGEAALPVQKTLEAFRNAQ
jgi:hypothetical protein